MSERMGDAWKRVWARSMARAAVQSGGGNSVALRMPAGAGSTDADELGLVAASFHEVPLAPVLVRTLSSGVDVLVSADVLHDALAMEDAHAVQRALQDCGGVSVFGKWMFVREVEPREVGGEPYLYRIRLTATEGNA